MKYYGIYHIDGHRSQNYPWTYECPVRAEQAIGAGILNDEAKARHKSRYVVKEFSVDDKSLQDAEQRVFVALEEFSDQMLEQLSCLATCQHETELLVNLAEAEMARRDLCRGPQ